MHVEIFNTSTRHSYYVITENNVNRIQIHHQDSKRQLAWFNSDRRVHEVLDDIYPLVQKLLSELGTDEVWIVRIFDLGTVPVNSLTRNSANLLGDFSVDVNTTRIDGPVEFTYSPHDI